FACLLLSGLVLLDEAAEAGRRARDLLAGAAFGLAYLTRPEGVLLAAVAWLGSVLSGSPGRIKPRAGFVLGLSLLVLPWVALLQARRRAWPMAAMLISLPLMYAPFSRDQRFFVPAVPWVLALAAAGIERVAAWLAPPARRAGVAIGITAALAAGGAGYAMVHPLMESAPEHRAAGVWLRAA